MEPLQRFILLALTLAIGATAAPGWSPAGWLSGSSSASAASLEHLTATGSTHPWGSFTKPETFTKPSYTKVTYGHSKSESFEAFAKSQRVAYQSQKEAPFGGSPWNPREAYHNGEVGWHADRAAAHSNDVDHFSMNALFAETRGQKAAAYRGANHHSVMEQYHENKARTHQAQLPH